MFVMTITTVSTVKNERKHWRRRRNNMKHILVLIPEFDLEKIQQLIKSHYYPNRAEFIRLAIKDAIQLHSFSKNTTNPRKHCDLHHKEVVVDCFYCSDHRPNGRGVNSACYHLVNITKSGSLVKVFEG